MGKTHNIWHPIKLYQALKEARIRSLQWGGSLINRNWPRIYTDVRISKKKNIESVIITTTHMFKRLSRDTEDTHRKNRIELQGMKIAMWKMKITLGEIISRLNIAGIKKKKGKWFKDSVSETIQNETPEKIIQSIEKVAVTHSIISSHGWPHGKEFACNADVRDAGSIPGPRRSSGKGNGNPHQRSCLGNTLDRGAWGAIAHGGHKELDTTEQVDKNNDNTQVLKTLKERGGHRKIFEKLTNKFFPNSTKLINPQIQGAQWP